MSIDLGLEGLWLLKYAFPEKKVWDQVSKNALSKKVSFRNWYQNVGINIGIHIFYRYPALIVKRNNVNFRRTWSTRTLKVPWSTPKEEKWRNVQRLWSKTVYNYSFITFALLRADWLTQTFTPPLQDDPEKWWSHPTSTPCSCPWTAPSVRPGGREKSCSCVVGVDQRAAGLWVFVQLPDKYLKHFWF